MRATRFVRRMISSVRSLVVCNDQAKAHRVNITIAWLLIVAGCSRRLATIPLFCLAILASAPAPAIGQQFSQFFGFGDSSIDSGYFRTHPFGGNQTQYNASVAVGGGIPTTPGGKVISEVLASRFGLTAIPNGTPGGTNYAASGARNTNALLTPAAPNTVSQIQTYLGSNGGRANSQALYMISSGANDVSDALARIPAQFTIDTAIQHVQSQAAALTGAIGQLKLAGAQYFVVPNCLGADCTYTDQPTTNRFPRLHNAYRNALWNGLAAAGINFIPADLNSVYRAIQANPVAFGFTNIASGSTITNTGGACVNPGTSSSWALVCTTLVAPNAQNTFLFADNTHLTEAGQKLFGDYIYSVLVAPSQISYLAELPVKTRAAVVDTIFNQVRVSQSGRQTHTFNTWVSGDLSYVKMDNSRGFPSDPGHPMAASIGVDYAFSSVWLVGAALSGGTTQQSYSSGGDFQQNALAGSIYGAYADGPWWMNATAAVGLQQYDVNRNVAAGLTLQRNTASTNGAASSLGSEGGYSFSYGPWKHGPFAGAIGQNIRVNSFTETGSFTSLSFDSQTRNSLVGRGGYQVVLDAGAWRPFARAAWNHEFVDSDRNVRAFLTTISAPGYLMPAVVLGRDWGTASVGANLALSSNVTGLIVLNGQLEQRAVTSYGAQIGVNVALGRRG